MQELPRALAIVGPTASGKSELGLEAARRFDLHVVCCDSVQVYRGLDIGSNKPDAHARARVPHHLLDVVDPNQVFTAGDYALKARSVVRSERVVFVGGTGMYLEQTLMSFSGSQHAAAGATIDDVARLQFDGAWRKREATEPGAAHRALAAIDPQVAGAIHPHNVVRCLRALWLCHAYGEPVSRVRGDDPPQKTLDVLAVVLDPEQRVLDHTIARRVDEMLERGFVNEVENLRRAGYDARHKAMRSLGYRQLLEHVEGRSTLEAARASIVVATRQYARRQRTFFRHRLASARSFRVARIEECPWSTMDAFLRGAPT